MLFFSIYHDCNYQKTVGKAQLIILDNLFEKALGIKIDIYIAPLN